MQGEAAVGGERGELLARLARRGGQVDVRVGEGGRAAAGGGQQVLDQPGHPGGRTVDTAGGRAALLLVRLLRGQYGVQVGADDRERAAQLVRGVVDELALGAERLVEPVQHGVHRVGEVAQLVLGALQLDAFREVGGLDLRRRAGDGAYGAQGAAGEDPAEDEAGGGEAAEDGVGEAAQVGERLVVDGRLDLLELHGVELAHVDAVHVLLGAELLADRVGLAAAFHGHVGGAEDECGEDEQEAGVQDGEAEADGVGEGGQAREPEGKAREPEMRAREPEMWAREPEMRALEGRAFHCVSFRR